MNKTELLDRIHRDWLVTIFRADTAAEACDAFEAMISGGATIVEVTLTTPGAYGVIETIRNRHGEQVIVCAGTVTTVDEARAAIDAGAQALISPNVYAPVIEYTVGRGAISVPGCLTPTEIADALRCGADIIKLFPCDAVGPEYLSYILGPFPGTRVMPVGRITLENMQSYYDKKAFSGCVSTTSMGVLGDIRAGRFDRVTSAMRRWVDAVQKMLNKESQR
jgi:2-dehydro-3-deoxyphosphogluconate aldolase / (4S)-4-hydroxy-2-oxoglutarate aldolase